MSYTHRREEIIRREMEAAWRPPSPNTELPGYDPEADPFCPLGIARRFNNLQREATTRGAQSLIDLRATIGEPNAVPVRNTFRGRSRPRSSGACVSQADVPKTGGGGCRPSGGGVDYPFLVGARAAQRRRDEGLTAVRRPPLIGKGLPSATQISRGLAGSAKRCQLAEPKMPKDPRIMSSRLNRGVPFELGADAEQDFAAWVARRHELLQDLWLKMHAGENFTTMKGDIAQLLRLYRSASLRVLEDIMRRPELERVADARTKKNGEGMQSYREAMARDADFADGIPEASAWLGFSTHRNPLFLPPKGGTLPHEIGLDDADDLGRLRDAQDFVLGADPYVATTPPRFSEKRESDGTGAGVSAAEPSGAWVFGDRVRAINAHLDTAQETMHNLEISIKSLESDRERERGKSARLREAAVVAGKRKLARKMYRLRGTAACVEEGIEKLDKEINTVRVRLFAERLEVERKRMIKSAIVTKCKMKSRERRRRERKGKPDEARHRLDRSPAAVVVQSRFRGEPWRDGAVEVAAARDDDEGRCHEAATRIVADARRGLARKQAATQWPVAPREAVNGAESAAGEREAQTKEMLDSPGGVSTSQGERCQVGREQRRWRVTDSNPDEAAEEIFSVSPEVSNQDGVAANLSVLETLGPAGVNAFFDFLGLGACTPRLRLPPSSSTRENSLEARGGRGLDGADLTRIILAQDPDAELLAVGIDARLHRVKVMAAFGINVTGRPGLGSTPSRRENDLSRPLNYPPEIAAPITIQMIRRLRRGQIATVDAFRRLQKLQRTRDLRSMDVVRQSCGGEESEGSASFQKSVELSPALMDENAGAIARLENADGVFGDASMEREASNSGQEGGGFLVPLEFLSELEKAVSAQEIISRQARGLLQPYASVQSTGLDDHRVMDPATVATDTNARSTLEP